MILTINFHKLITIFFLLIFKSMRNVSRQLNKEKSTDKKSDNHDDDDIQYLGTESSQQNWQNQVEDFLGQCASKSPKKKRSRRFKKRKR